MIGTVAGSTGETVVSGSVNDCQENRWPSLAVGSPRHPVTMQAWTRTDACG